MPAKVLGALVGFMTMVLGQPRKEMSAAYAYNPVFTDDSI